MTYIPCDAKEAVTTYFASCEPAERAALQRVPQSPFPAADTAACVLGRDLWIPPFAAFRDDLIASGERPHLWTFTFQPSAAWDSTRWRSLSVDARVVRTRCGSPTRRIVVDASPQRLCMSKAVVAAALRELQSAGMYRAQADGVGTFEPAADAGMLDCDLHLVEILAHWLQTLAHREIVLHRRDGSNGYDVSGHAGACALCRERWGSRAHDPQWVAPFHPGCRCFAQPRYL